MIETQGDILKGFALIFSNIGLLPAIALCIYYNLIPEATVYSVVCFISTIYHVCQADFLCVYSFKVLQTSDHFFVFNLLVWTTLYFIGLNLKIKFLLFMIIQAFLLPAVIQYLENWWVGGVLLALLILITVFVLSQLTPKIRVPDLLDITFATLFIGGGFALHLYGGEPGSENYWWAHSIWHLLGMGSLYFIVQMRSGNGILHDFVVDYRSKSVSRKSSDLSSV
jgi:hypothetical protein